MAEEIRQMWNSADCVCMDVDSTVIVDESIDCLAEFLGKGDEVSAITVAAMQGTQSYQAALKARLDIMNPSRQQVALFMESHPARFTPDVNNLVNVLHSRSVPVYLISGGFRCIIEPMAAVLNIPREHIFANELLFYFNGDYGGFDVRQPTCMDGGKALVIKHLKETFGYQRVIHIGDGVTDLEACPPADAFIGFGGNVVRESVRQKSLWFVTSFSELIDELS